jgi:large subunit ribosomal protein L28
MARKCDLTGSRPRSGNNRSRANNKTKRVWNPNVQSKRIWVPELGRFVRLKVTARALRTLDRKGLTQFLKDAGLTLADLRRR